MERAENFEGRMRLMLRDANGAIVLERRAANVVLRSGAELVAALFSGGASTPVNGVGVGVNATPASVPYEAATLTVTTPDGTPILQASAAPIDPATIQTQALQDQLRIRVSLRSVIGPNRAVSPDDNVRTVEIAEAALGVLAPDGNSLAQIYNRVVFEPVPKARDQELALYWEIDFPYGV
ncbi:MAG: hypothetical protein WD696_11940 [Bryobacteraceae bacterium]